MKKRLMVSVTAVAMFGLMAAFASSAQAYPTKTTACTECHNADSAVSVSATLVSTDTAGALYSVAVNNPYGNSGWAAFAGATKAAGAAGSGGNVAVPWGATYTAYGVSVGTGNGLAATTFGPGANPVVGSTPAIATHSFTYRFKLGKRGNKGLTAVLTNPVTGAKYTAKVSKRGYAVFSNIPDGSYKLSVKVKGKKFKFKARTISVG